MVRSPGELNLRNASAIHPMAHTSAYGPKVGRQWRFAHVQLVERVLGPLTGGSGGTLGAKYLARTIDQKFFPALWAVRARFYGSAG